MSIHDYMRTLKLLEGYHGVLLVDGTRGQILVSRDSAMALVLNMMINKERYDPIQEPREITHDGKSALEINVGDAAWIMCTISDAIQIVDIIDREGEEIQREKEQGKSNVTNQFK